MAEATSYAPVGARETLLHRVVPRAVHFGIYAGGGERVVLRGGHRCHRRCIHRRIAKRIRVRRVWNLVDDRLRGLKSANAHFEVIAEMRLLVEKHRKVVKVDYCVAPRTVVSLKVRVEENRQTLLNCRLRLHVTRYMHRLQARSSRFPTFESTLLLIHFHHVHSAHNYYVLPWISIQQRRRSEEGVGQWTETHRTQWYRHSNSPSHPTPYLSILKKRNRNLSKSASLLNMHSSTPFLNSGQ